MRVALWAVLVAGCSIEPELVQCGDYLCPVGTLCDTAHDSCATREQFDVCVGIDEADDCLANGIDGGCFDGVCLRRGCGNGIVESDEQCDDRNERSGDGCSSNCRSNETCGNGVVDSNEQCDDGALLSRDGCDSRCIAEIETWREIPISVNVGAFECVDDESRQRLVLPKPGGTWELIGETWRTAAPSPFTMRAPYFDPVRGAVVALHEQVFNSTYASAFDGTAWSTISGELAMTVYSSTFDRARSQALVLGSTKLAMLGPTGSWSDYAPQPPNTSGVLVFDPANAEIVVLEAFTNGEKYFDPAKHTVWQTRTPPFTTITAYGLDGSTLVVVADLTVYRRSSTGWTADAEELPFAITSGSGTGVVYRRGTTLFIERGFYRCRRQTFVWTCASAPSGLLSQDADSNMVLVGRDSIWTFDNTDTLSQPKPVTSSPSGFEPSDIEYSPGRGAILGIGVIQPCGPCNTETQQLGPTGWTRIVGGETIPYTGPLVYNPDARALVHQRNYGDEPFAMLADDSSVWTTVPLPAQPNQYLKWDARQHHYVSLSIAPFTSFVYDYVGPGWEQDELAPEGEMASDERTGSVVVIPSQFELRRKVWERRGGVWRPYGELPYEISVGSTAYESDRGRLWVISYESSQLAALVHEYSSPTPLETCTDATADLDGDGLAGCADPDCYWACGGCPPFATCRALP